MSMTPGTRLGPYEIGALLGAGGMGEVYRARDARLGRDVAVKVLPAAFAADADRVARFEREAKAIAALSHPNVVAVFDTGSHDGQIFVVTELLAGHTLRERLGEGALPVRKAVDVAIQIARGLAAAHDRGLVHRDIKPENVFLLGDGQVKVLDFGLARQMSTGSGATETAGAITDPGTVMGTIGYMAPEQVRGQTVDARADLFALGAVLYEMLSGARAFHRDSSADTMIAIVKEDPADFGPQRPDISPALERIVRHCLEKQPSERFQSARDVAFALEALSSSGGAAPASATAPPRSARPRWGLAAAALAVGALAGALLTTFLRSPDVPARPWRFTVSPGGLNIQRFSPPALSPDGRVVAFAASRTASRQGIWLWRLDERAPVPLAGSDGAHSPFWSPRGDVIAFFADDQLKRVNVTGGAVQPICEAPGPVGVSGTWNQDDVIVFSDSRGSLRRVSASGGPSSVVIPPSADRGETALWWPHFLPDGRHVLFTAISDERTAYVGSVDDSGDPIRLLAAESPVTYADGFIVYAYQHSLFAHPFDATRRTLGQDARRIADVEFTHQDAQYTVAGSTLVAMSHARSTRLSWIDRSGRETPLPQSDTDQYGWPAVSLAGRVALDRTDLTTGRRAVVTLDASGATTRLTSDAFDNSDVVWSPDGDRVVYGYHDGSALKALRLGLAVAPETLIAFDRVSQAYPTDWSPSGLIAYTSFAPSADVMLWSLAEKRSIPIRTTSANEGQARFSRDGRWIAFSSDEDQRPEVWIQQVPPGQVKRKVSVRGGTQPMWGDRELFYIDEENWVVAVDVQLGSTVHVGPPTKLFPVRIEESTFYWVRNHYVAMPDGRRFLVNNVSVQAPQILLGWQAFLSR